MGLRAHTHSEGEQQTYGLISRAATRRATSNEAFTHFPPRCSLSCSPAPTTRGGRAAGDGLAVVGRRDIQLFFLARQTPLGAVDADPGGKHPASLRLGCKGSTVPRGGQHTARGFTDGRNPEWPRAKRARSCPDKSTSRGTPHIPRVGYLLGGVLVHSSPPSQNESDPQHHRQLLGGSARSTGTCGGGSIT